MAIGFARQLFTTKRKVSPGAIGFARPKIERYPLLGRHYSDLLTLVVAIEFRIVVSLTEGSIDTFTNGVYSRTPLSFKLF